MYFIENVCEDFNDLKDYHSHAHIIQIYMHYLVLYMNFEIDIVKYDAIAQTFQTIC